MRRTDTAQGEALAKDKTGGHPVDRHVGQAVRLRRKLLGLSQQALAQRLGLTFQQVQKYETGANRISASALYGIAHALGAPVSAFFDGLPAVPPGRDDAGADALGGRALVTRMLTAPGGVALAAAWLDLPPGPLRLRLAGLVEATADAFGRGGARDDDHAAVA